jgi:FeS assembly SUF system protein
MFSLLRKNKCPSKTGNELQAQIVAALKRVYDPEIPINIYDLGLIYDMEVKDGGEVTVAMTLTAPACPVAGILPKQVETAVNGVEGVTQVSVELVWDPPWSPERMSDEARLSLGLL